MYREFCILISSLIVFKGISRIKAQGYNKEVERHLELGRQFLSQGMYNDALSHYHAAVDGDPENYLTHFKRATVYLAVGKIASAIRDLTRVIELKPDFLAARMQRGSVLLKQGKLDEAHIDYENVLHMDPMNPDAQHAYGLIEQLKRDVILAYEMYHDHNYAGAIDVITQLLQELPWDTKLRETRAECYEFLGDLIGAISDLKPIVKSDSNNQARFLKLSKLHYEVGDTEEALNAIRECIKFDPDHKECFAYYKHIKKVAAHLKAVQEHIANREYAECVDRAKKALPLETATNVIMHYIRARLCLCLNKNNELTEAVHMCTEAINLNNEDIETLCERAEAHIANEDYTAAMNDYHAALGINENSRRAHEGLKRTQKLEKQSRKRDYYKILGVRRTAGKREILKAYRKLAQKWHPDNFQGDEKATAEKKFIDIAAAKEVLTDPEMRQKFDNGEDPLDPESQAGQNFNPFAQGFNFGRNGPFTFKFHFS